MGALNWFASAPMPVGFSIQPIDHVIQDASPFTGTEEVTRRFHQWHVRFDWNAMVIGDYLALKSHLTRTRGGARIFKVPILEARARRGSKSGDPTLSGAHGAGVTELTITAGGGTFLAGDWIWISQATDVPRAYLVTSSESGGVIEVEPGLRIAHSTGSLIHHIGRSADPEIYDTMKIATPEPVFAMVDVQPTPRYAMPFSIEFVSALRLSP